MFFYYEIKVLDEMKLFENLGSKIGQDPFIILCSGTETQSNYFKYLFFFSVFSVPISNTVNGVKNSNTLLLFTNK